MPALSGDRGSAEVRGVRVVPDTVPSGSWWAACLAFLKLVLVLVLLLGLGWLMRGSLVWRCRDCGEIMSDEDVG